MVFTRLRLVRTAMGLNPNRWTMMIGTIDGFVLFIMFILVLSGTLVKAGSKTLALVCIAFGILTGLLDLIAPYSYWPVKRKLFMTATRVSLCVAYLICTILGVLDGTIAASVVLLIMPAARLAQLILEPRERFTTRGAPRKFTSIDAKWMINSEMREWLPLKEAQSEAKAVFEDSDGMISQKPQARESWYAPPRFMRKRRSRRNGAQAGPHQEPDPYFCRCYCCLDSDIRPGAMKGARREYAPGRIDIAWSRCREEFLNRPPSGHFGDIHSTVSPDLRDLFVPHQLCPKCEFMCSKSSLIRRTLLGSSWQQELKSTASLLDLSVDDGERFQLYDSIAELQVSAQGSHGNPQCHLCNLFLDTLSIEQQRHLSSRDDSRVYIRIELRGSFTNTAFTPFTPTRSFEPWLRMIPHFGNQIVARRWIKKRLATRMLQQGLSPLLNNREEQAEAILIFLSPPVNRGPLKLPLSMSTNSDATFQMLKTWVDRHKDCHETYVATLQHDQANIAPRSQESVPGERIDPELVEHPVVVELRDMDRARQIARDSLNTQLAKLPARFVDVGFFSYSSPFVKICQTQHLLAATPGSSIEYLALSHCWGRAPPDSVMAWYSNLSTATIQTHLKSIEISRLYRSFQDAILIARKTGVRYLWIDSLCIVRDGPDQDWEAEAVKMKDVYANALFVIANLAAWDCTETTFVAQNPLAMSPCLIGATSRGQTAYAVPNLRYTGASLADYRYSRIKSRAWCMQEELLARRIVYFGPHQVFMDCKPSLEPKTWQRFHQAGTAPWTTDECLKYEIVAPVGRFQDEPVNDEVRNILRKDWFYSIVNDYSVKLLTQEADKLIALAGLSGRFREEARKRGSGVNYVAGLWGGPHLVSGLLWFVANSDTSKRIGPPFGIGDYRAPSWSWASVSGTIRHNSIIASDSTSRLTIINVKAEGPEDEKPNVTIQFPLGKVNSAELQVAGAIKSAILGTWEQASETRYYRGHRPQPPNMMVRGPAELNYFLPYDDSPSSGPKCYPLYDDANPPNEIGMFLPDDANEILVLPHDSQINLLQIVVEPEERSLREDFGTPYACRGLALQKLKSLDDAQGQIPRYRRMGYFELLQREGETGTIAAADFITGPRSQLRYGEPARDPGPVIDPFGFFDGVPHRAAVLI